MRDVDELIRAMGVPRTTAPAPRVAARRPVWLALAVAAAVLGLVIATVPDRAGLRGVRDPTVRVDLQVVVERGGVAVRATPGGRYRVGERAFFRLAATKQANVDVWVDGPGGREEIARAEADGAPRDLGDPSGLTAYRFDQPGTYVFGISTPDGGCGDGCPSLTVEVE